MLESFLTINVITLRQGIQVNFNLSNFSVSTIMAQKNTAGIRNPGKDFWKFADNRLVCQYLYGTIEIVTMVVAWVD